MPLARLPNLNLAYAQSGSGPDVLLLHGFGADRQFWMPTITEYLAVSFRVTACDLRGHGESDRPARGYTSADAAGDLPELLDALGIARAHVVGHSFGGRVALQLACSRPDRVVRLAIVDSRVDALQPVPRLRDWPQWETWREALNRIGVAADGDTMMTYAFFIGWLRQLLVHRTDADLPHVLREFALWPGAETAIQHWDVLESQTTAAADMEQDPGLDKAAISRIAHPALGLYGALSFCLPTLSKLQALMPQLTGTVVPDVGHRLPLRRPFLFRRLIRDFLTTGSVAAT